MRRKVGIGLNALIAVLAMASAILRSLDGELLLFAILLLLAVLKAVALMILTPDLRLYEIKCYAISKRNKSYMEKPPLQMIMFY